MSEKTKGTGKDTAKAPKGGAKDSKKNTDAKAPKGGAKAETTGDSVPGDDNEKRTITFEEHEKILAQSNAELEAKLRKEFAEELKGQTEKNGSVDMITVKEHEEILAFEKKTFEDQLKKTLAEFTDKESPVYKAHLADIEFKYLKEKHDCHVVAVTGVFLDEDSNPNVVFAKNVRGGGCLLINECNGSITYEPRLTFNAKENILKHK